MREEVKAGITIILSLLVLSAFVILVGGSRFYEKFDSYYIEVMNAAGLETGAQVRLGGLKVGRILDIRPPKGPGGKITIEVGIKRGTTLYEGTKAIISQVGFVGDIYLLLAIDKTTNKEIDPKKPIPAEEQIQLGEVMGKVMGKVNGISQSVESLIKDVNKIFSQKNIEGIESLVENTNKSIVSGSSSIEKIAASLKGTSDKLNSVLNEVEGLVKDNKGEITVLIKKTREDLDKAGDMLKAIEQTAKSLDKTSRSVDNAINSQSQNLDNLFNTMTRATDDLQDVLQEIKNKPWSIVYKGGGESEE